MCLKYSFFFLEQGLHAIHHRLPCCYQLHNVVLYIRLSKQKLLLRDCSSSRSTFSLSCSYALQCIISSYILVFIWPFRRADGEKGTEEEKGKRVFSLDCQGEGDRGGWECTVKRPLDLHWKSVIWFTIIFHQRSDYACFRGYRRLQTAKVRVGKTWSNSIRTDVTILE